MKQWMWTLAGLAGLVFFVSCSKDPDCPSYYPTCNDPGTVPTPQQLGAFPHRPAKVYDTVLASAPTGMAIEQTADSVRAFVGNKNWKLAFTVNGQIYMLLPYGGAAANPVVVKVTHNDEGADGSNGVPSEPLFSRDGRYLAYQGSKTGSLPGVSFMQVADTGLVWRTPLNSPAKDGDEIGQRAFSPHWWKDKDTTSGKSYILFNGSYNLDKWVDSLGSIPGQTYWVQVNSDSSVGIAEEARFNGYRLPGAFKGGVSRDGLWAGTSYATTVLYNAANYKSIKMNGGQQQCNPSINQLDPASTTHTDYLMILAFGGVNLVTPIVGTPISETQHEHLWIFNQSSKAVWRAKMPGLMPGDNASYSGYGQWQKPEWSTHPNFAVATAKAANGQYDIFIVKLTATGTELATNPETALLDRDAVLRVTVGALDEGDLVHLWVEEP